MTLLIGGLLIIAALVVGHFEGYLMGVKVRNVTALVGKPELNPRDCVCGHSHSTHKAGPDGPGSGACQCLVGKHGDFMCACMVYIPKPEKPAPKGALEL